MKKKNNIPEEVYKKATSDFDDRNKYLDWENYYKSLPFNSSALALYEWSPIAEELKVLDRKIVLNSMILKWDNIQKEFKELISFQVFFLFSTKLLTTLGSARVVVSPS